MDAQHRHESSTASEARARASRARALADLAAEMPGQDLIDEAVLRHEAARQSLRAASLRLGAAVPDDAVL